MKKDEKQPESSGVQPGHTPDETPQESGAQTAEAPGEETAPAKETEAQAEEPAPGQEDSCEDPGEERDLIGEAACKPVADELFRRLTGWFDRYADPAMDGAKEGVTGMGQLCRPGLYADRREVFAPLPAPIPRE